MKQRLIVRGNTKAELKDYDGGCADWKKAANLGNSDGANFPQQVNVGFMQIINKQQVKLRVYERGVGQTQACGSGACAASELWGAIRLII